MLIHTPRWYVCVGRPFVVLAKVAWNNWRFYKRRRMLKTRNGRVYGFHVTHVYILSIIGILKHLITFEH